MLSWSILCQSNRTPKSMTPPSPISTFPNHILEWIMTFVTNKVSDIVSYTTVQKKWLFLRYSNTVHQHSWFCLRKNPYLERVTKNDEYIPLPIQILFHSIRFLKCSNLNNRDDFFSILTKFPNITNLELLHSNAEERVIFQPYIRFLECQYWPNLQQLYIESIMMADGVTISISKMLQLRILSLSECRLSCSSIVFLAKIPNLEFLELKRCDVVCSERYIPQHTEDYLSERETNPFPYLTYLSIRVTRPETEFEFLNWIPNLTVLQVSQKSQLQKCFYPQLEVIVIRRTLSDTLFNNLKKYSKLRHVVLKLTKFDIERNKQISSFLHKKLVPIGFTDIFFVPDRNAFIATKIPGLQNKPWLFWKSIYKYPKLNSKPHQSHT